MTELTPLVETLTKFIQMILQQKVSDPIDIKETLKHQALNLETFEEQVELFSNYYERLENYFKLRGLDTNDAKVMFLINCLGNKHHRTLSSLTSPDLPSTKSYNHLIEKSFISKNEYSH